MVVDIIIQSVGWQDVDLVVIEEVFGSHNVEKKHLALFDADLTVAIVIVIHMSNIILSSIGNAIGQDIWNALRSKLSLKSNKNRSTIGFSLKNNNQEIHLNIDSHDQILVKKALDSIDNVLQQTPLNNEKISLYFDPNVQNWSKITPKKFMKKYTCAIANTESIKQGSKTHEFTKENLKEFSRCAVGKPVPLGHGGKQIGEITKAWMDDNNLMVELGIYDGISDDDLQELQRMIDSGGGLSIGIVISNEDKDL